VSTLTTMSAPGVKVYHTVARSSDPPHPPSAGSAVASRVSRLSLNGSVVMTVAPVTSSFDGGAAAAGPVQPISRTSMVTSPSLRRQSPHSRAFMMSPSCSQHGQHNSQQKEISPLREG
jgi:hypothetical protein